MKGFIRLLRLQTTMRLAALKPKNIKAEFHEKRSRAATQAIAIVILLIMMGVYTVLIETNLLDAFIALGTPEMLLGMVTMVSMMLTLLLGLFYVMSMLYFSKDASFLASLPVTSTQVFASKMSQVWISEIGISALFVLPACIIFSMKVNVSAMLFLRAIFITVFAPVIPLCIAALLTTLLTKLAGFWKHRETIATVGGMILLFGMIAGELSLSSMMPEDVSQEAMVNMLGDKQTMIQNITRAFPPADWAAQGLCGNLGQLALFIAVSIACAALLILLLGKGYLNMALLQGETAQTGKKLDMKTVRYGSNSQLKALFKREVSEVLRTPTYMMNCMSSVIMPVVMIVAMGVGFGSNSKVSINEMVMELVNQLGDMTIFAAALCGLMSLFVGMNVTSATAVSREGKKHALYRMMPVSPRTVLKAKMLAGLTFAEVGVLAAIIVVVAFIPQLIVPAAEALVLALLIGYIFSCLGVIVDAKRPKMNWSNETEAVKQNFNLMISMFVGMLFIGVLALLSYLMFSNGITGIAYIGIMAALLVALCFASKWWLERTADKDYAKIEG